MTTLRLPALYSPIAVAVAVGNYVYADMFFPIGATEWAEFPEYVASFNVLSHECGNIVKIEILLGENEKKIDFYEANDLAQMVLDA